MFISNDAQQLRPKPAGRGVGIETLRINILKERKPGLDAGFAPCLDPD